MLTKPVDVGSAPAEGRRIVAFSDYGVTAPSAPIVASVDDRAVVEVQLYFTRS